MSKAILVVSFGTSHDETRRKNIYSIEALIASSFPDYKVVRAFTSGMIINILAKRGIIIDNAAEAIENLIKGGITELVVQPTHLMHGLEYDKLLAMLEPYKQFFKSVAVGHPLLDTTEDLKAVVKTIAEHFPLANDEALVLMGHGSTHFANAVYAALDYMFKDMGYPTVHVGTVEGYPEIASVQRSLSSSGVRKITLAPLMLVAGDHAVNDMSSDEEDSWKTIFTEAGYETDCVLKGLGEYDGIRSLYVKHISDAIGSI